MICKYFLSHKITGGAFFFYVSLFNGPAALNKYIFIDKIVVSSGFMLQSFFMCFIVRDSNCGVTV